MEQTVACQTAAMKLAIAIDEEYRNMVEDVHSLVQYDDRVKALKARNAVIGRVYNLVLEAIKDPVICT